MYFDPLFQVQLGSIFRSRQSHEAALLCYKKAVALNPDSSPMHKPLPGAWKLHIGTSGATGANRWRPLPATVTWPFRHERRTAMLRVLIRLIRRLRGNVLV